MARSCFSMDMIFVARQIQEKCQEQNKDRYIAFTDLTKAFESINYEALWKVLSRCGCPTTFITILRLHDKMTATVLINGTEQSLSPSVQRWSRDATLHRLSSLFTYVQFVFLSVTEYRVEFKLTTGSMGDFKLSRLKAKTKVTKTDVIDLQYADNCAILAYTAEELQLDILTEAYHSLGLSINIRKTKIIIPVRSRQHWRTSWF